ncbi:hypothetical protein EON80_18025 [bacterium]|nr:MAG: hypothetical protein EON80_18025 [bacterium]
MKRHWIEYRQRYTSQPMSGWVHRPVLGLSRQAPTVFHPPLPKPVPGEGFAVFFVEIDGFTFRFASLDEISEFIAIMSQKLFPSSLRTSGLPNNLHIANNHWLNRLPKKTKTWRYRQKAVKTMIKALADFEKELARSRR